MRGVVVRGLVYVRVWCVFVGVDMRLGPCVSDREFILVLVSMPISVPLSISANTSVDVGFVCVWAGGGQG